MDIGTGMSDSLLLSIGIFLAGGIVVWLILYFFFKIKNFGFAFLAGYITLLIYTIVSGWNPADAAAFSQAKPELLRLSWPSILLKKFLPAHLHYLILSIAALQYVLVGWFIDLFIESIFGKN